MPDDPNRYLGFLLNDVARLLRRSFERRSQELGLSRAQYSVLANLYRKEGIRQTKLADILEIEPITLVRLLDRLEEGGWVERRPDPTDRRARCLYLTEKARPMIARMKALAAEVRGVATEGLPEEDRERLLDMLSHIKTNLLNEDRPSHSTNPLPTHPSRDSKNA
ncbi:MarR family transcriptional regulator [Inquilinus sp. CAU 1745]|uniref:MarR family winged helix-turn-helix transcriptional regulator n=1 Tax=Inquilinus sp. CAU 1745 TaxID=3140369 RepID=UPI00325BF0B3